MKFAIFLLFAVAGGSTLYAQDTLMKINGRKIAVEVQEVKSFEVLYKTPDRPEQSVKSISRSQVANIRYADGRADTFFVMDKKGMRAHVSLKMTDSMYQFGKRDARIYYTRFQGAATGTFLTTFPGSPALGLITALSTSLTAPKEHNLEMPNSVLAANADYHTGYKKTAWSVKRKKVWTSWGIGVGVTAITVLVIEALKTPAR